MDRTLPFMSMMPSTFCAAREEIFSTTFSSMVSLYCGSDDLELASSSNDRDSSEEVSIVS